LSTYGELLESQRGELTSQRARLLEGVAKLRTANEDVAAMRAQLNMLQPKLAQRQEGVKQLLVKVCGAVWVAAVSGFMG